MSLTTSPAIVTNGLVLSIDTQNIKSYKGPAIQNLLTTITPDGLGVSTGYSGIGGSEVIDIPQLGPTAVQYTLIQNNYTSFTPTNANCCPRIMYYGSNITVTPSTLYTYGIVYKVDSGYTGPNYMYHYEYNGATYVNELGVHTTANRIHLGNGWWWAWGTFTTQPSTNLIVNAGAWYYQYSQQNDKFSVAKVLLTAGDKTQLHPKYWPAVGTTLANTSVLQDTSGNSKAITANSLTYASNGDVSFNGSSNYATVAADAAWAFGQNGTVEQWVYISGNSGSNNRLWCTTNTSAGLDAYLNGATYNLYLHGGTVGTTTVLPTNTWVHITVTYTGGTVAIYFNGVAQTLTGTITGYNITNAGMLYIGEYSGGGAFYLNGKISIMKIYNRGLSAAEVAQNFYSLRGRYGI